MSTPCTLDKDKEGILFEQINYGVMIGCILYLSVSCSNVLFVLCLHTCFQASHK